MKKIIFGILLLALPFVAISAGSKSEILRLTHEIESALLDSQASESAIEEARQDLEHALQLINSSGGGGGGSDGPSNACIDYAYAKYYQSQSSSDAMDNAAAACRKIADLSIADYLWQKYYQSLSSAAAMDLAADGATRDVAGKMDILQFAWGKYYQSLSAADASTRAVAATRKVARSGLSCVTNAWSRYYQSQSAAAAMDSAANFCASNGVKRK